jgi:gamma-glutamyltranspeptidase/glutathione hydrolase
MAQVLAPTIAYARAKAIRCTRLIAYYWERSVPVLSQWPGFTEQFTLDGRAPREGRDLEEPESRNTLEAIARGGRDAFYKGEIARTHRAYFQAKAVSSYGRSGRAHAANGSSR